jgi:predicted unusual protein kinase regulating ubiquinone biosynthesis (AarF/ABC1/UbiB family)
MAEKLPTSFTRRSAKVTTATAAQGARHAATLAANLLRDDDAAAEVMERRHREAAERMVAVLGTMKGGAMKLGQMASFLHVDFIPPEYRDLYQRELASLRDAAPPMPWKQVERVLREELDEPPERVFAELDPEAAAAASIGQVHRGRLRDGREVAVKLQYPEIADALETDVRTVSVLSPIARAIAPGIDVRAAVAELRERILEELDYELEAQNQRAFARAYRGHPFIHVPDVVTELSRRRVVVGEWVDGAPFDHVLASPQPERDRFGEVLVRFFYGSADVVGRFNADAHPGNYLLRPDGGVSFLDFGAVKAVDRARRELVIECARAIDRRDAPAVVAGLERLGWLNHAADLDPEMVLRHVLITSGWVYEDLDLTLTTERIARAATAIADPRSEVFRVWRHENHPAEDLMFSRMEAGVVSVLAQLNATANWNRMAREWWYGDDPQTDLGRAEWEFLKTRPLWRDPRAGR